MMRYELECPFPALLSPPLVRLSASVYASVSGRRLNRAVLFVVCGFALHAGSAAALTAASAGQVDADTTMNTPAATPAPSSATQAPPLAMPDLVRYRADLEEMQRLRRTNEVLRLRLENQKLEAGLAKLNSGAASIDADDADSLQGALTNWVGARGDAARAQIWLRGQGTLQIVTGDLVGNGWRVAQISANGVVLQRKGRRYVLPFGTAQAPSTTGTES